MGIADALYAVETQFPNRGFAKRFFSAPIGAEITGPCFAPSGRDLFLSVQHPGPSIINNGAQNWPNFIKGLPPRPSVVYIRKDDGGEIA